jgi:uncharacterized protein YebE (UPF0316 family)
MDFITSESILFDYVILPLLIMMARVLDVSMDTIRVIMVAKGYRNYAPIIGFFQSLIWVITISRVMVNLENWTAYIGYAGGFSLGTYVGMRLEEKLALGHELIRVITKSDATELVNILRAEGFPVTAVNGQGRDGEVGILFIIMKRKAIKHVVEVINAYNPKAFYTIEDMRFVRDSSYLPRSRRVIPSRGTR